MERSLREELTTAKDELQLVQRKFESMIHEKQQQQQNTQIEITNSEENLKLKEAQKREYDLEINVIKLEKAHTNLKTNCQRLETTIQKLNEDKLKLNLEVNEHKTTVQTLKDQLVNKEHSLKQTESDKKLYEEQNKTHEIVREKLEKDLRQGIHFQNL